MLTLFAIALATQIHTGSDLVAACRVGTADCTTFVQKTAANDSGNIGLCLRGHSTDKIRTAVLDQAKAWPADTTRSADWLAIMSINYHLCPKDMASDPE